MGFPGWLKRSPASSHKRKTRTCLSGQTWVLPAGPGLPLIPQRFVGGPEGARPRPAAPRKAAVQRSLAVVGVLGNA